jgi:hypothetical protein
MEIRRNLHSSNAKLCMLFAVHTKPNTVSNFRFISLELYLCLASLPFMSLFLPGSPHGALISVFKCDKSRTYWSQKKTLQKTKPHRRRGKLRKTVL